MASPPPTYSPAVSPPYQHSQLPSKKRGSTAVDLQSNKRRKASIMSATSLSSAHPLRHTSFPPEESQSQVFSPSSQRSPSIDTMSLVSGSQVSAVPVKKKRGRKSKAELARAEAEAARAGTPSVVGGPAPSVVSNASGAGGKQGGADDDGDAGGDAKEIAENMASQAATRSEEQIKQEEWLRARLKDRFTQDQWQRYEVWHRAKITLANVRKHINSTTSQSVAQSIPQAMQVVLKLFAGDIIEEARRVQQEWIAAGEKQTDLPDDKEKEDGISDQSKARRQAPLRPDHLQEAYRRWKMSNEGGGSGGSMMWWNQQTRNGAERFAPKVRGKRLFK